MAAPTVVAITSGGIYGSGSFTVSLPASSAGYVAFGEWYGTSGNLTAPAGWTAIEVLNVSGNSWGNTGIWYSNGTPGTSWNHGAAESASVVVVGYSTDIVIGPYAGTSYGDTTAQTSPSVTTSEASLILRAMGCNYWAGNASLTSTVTYPAGTANQAIQRNGPGTAGADHYMAAVAHSTQGSPGATGTGAWARVGTYTQSWARAITLAITTDEPYVPGPKDVSGTVAATSGTSVSIEGDRIVWDDYDRISTTPGTSSSGHAWSVIGGTWDVNGSTIGETTGTDNGIILLNTGVTDSLVESRFYGQGGMEAGQILARANSTGTTNYGLSVWTGREIQINKNIFTTLATTGTGQYTDGDLVSLRIVESGGSTVLTAYRNGTQVLTYTDSAGGRPNGTYVGYRHASGNPGLMVRAGSLSVKEPGETAGDVPLPARTFGDSFAMAANAVATAPVRVAWVGDSILEGWGATARANRPAQKFLDALRTDLGVTGGEGYLPTFYVHGESWKYPFVKTGTQTENITYGLGKRAYSSAAGSFTLTATGTHADLMWRGGGGTFTWRVDGGSTTSVNTAGFANNANIEGRKTRISLGSAGSHTITIARTAGTVIFEGAVVYNGDTTQGVNLYDWTHSGFYSSEAGDHGFTTNAPHWLDWNPQVVVFELVGANDYLWNNSTPAANLSNVETLVNRYLNLSSRPDVVLVIPRITSGPNTGSRTWNEYMDLVAGITHDRIKLVDLRADTAVTLADGVHPNNAGHAAMATAVFNALMDGGTAHVAAGTVAASTGTALTVTARYPVSATVAAATTAALTVNAIHPVTGTVAGVSGAALSVNARHPVTGTLPATTGTALAVNAIHPVTGTIAAVSGTTLSINAIHPVTGTVAADTTATLNAVLPGTSGTIAAISGTALTVNAVHPITGTNTNTTSTALTVGVRQSTAGSIAATSAVAASVTATHTVTGTITSTSSTALTATNSTTSGTVTATTTVTATITAHHPISGTIPVTSSANLNALPPGTSGTIAAISGTALTVTARHTVTGTITTTTGAALNAGVLTGLTGTVTATSTTSLTINGRYTTTATIPITAGTSLAVTARHTVAAHTIATSGTALYLGERITHPTARQGTTAHGPTAHRTTRHGPHAHAGTTPRGPHAGTSNG